MTPCNALGLRNNSNPAVSKTKLNSTKDNNINNNNSNDHHTVRFQDETKIMLVPFIVHISYLLREGWWHGVGHHWWWWRLLLGLWGRRLGVEWEWWVVHTILSGPLHTPKLRGTLEALVTKAAHLVCRSAKITLSIAVAVIAATIVTTRVTTIASIVATILGLTATKGALRPTAKPSVAVPVATTTEVTPPTPRIPIPAIILVATSSPPSTTCVRQRREKEGWVKTPWLWHQDTETSIRAAMRS